MFLSFVKSITDRFDFCSQVVSFVLLLKWFQVFLKKIKINFLICTLLYSDDLGIDELEIKYK